MIRPTGARGSDGEYILSLFTDPEMRCFTRWNNTIREEGEVSAASFVVDRGKQVWFPSPVIGSMNLILRLRWGCRVRRLLCSFHWGDFWVLDPWFWLLIAPRLEGWWINEIPSQLLMEEIASEQRPPSTGNGLVDAVDAFEASISSEGWEQGSLLHSSDSIPGDKLSWEFTFFIASGRLRISKGAWIGSKDRRFCFGEFVSRSRPGNSRMWVWRWQCIGSRRERFIVCPLIPGIWKFICLPSKAWFTRVRCFRVISGNGARRGEHWIEISWPSPDRERRGDGIECEVGLEECFEWAGEGLA